MLKIKIYKILLFVCVINITLASYGQIIVGNIQNTENVLSTLTSRYDFYQGVNLLNRGYITESLVAFQRAISSDQFALYQYMYARSNELYGLSTVSNNMFRLLSANNFEASFLQSKLELSQLFQSNYNDVYTFSQLIRASSFDLISMGYQIPMTLRVLPNGDIALVFLQSQSVIIFSPTGKIKFELGTGIAGLINPTDVLYTNNNMYLVTSFKNDDIVKFSKEGIYRNSFINKTPEIDTLLRRNFVGPQFLTQDKENNIYVSTYGSSLIFKFTENGDYILYFGNVHNNFQGLKQPTGIESIDNTIIVADYINRNSVLHIFDFNGNFLKTLPISNQKIETIRKHNKNFLIITTTDTVLLYDYQTQQILEELALADFSRLISAEFDSNKILWVVDQGRGRLEAYTYLTGQYSGLNVNINAIDTQKFPKVVMNFSILDSAGNPIVGLSKENFLLFENYSSVPNINVTEELNTAITNESIIIIPSVNSMQLTSEKNRIVDTLKDMTQDGQNLSVSNSAKISYWLLETKKLPNYLISDTSYSLEVLDKLQSFKSQDNNIESFITSIRFGLNTLLTKKGKKTIVFMGTPPLISKEQLKNQSIYISLTQLKEIMLKNNIVFVWITLQENEYSNMPLYFDDILSLKNSVQLSYLDEAIMDTIFNSIPFGSYQLTFNSIQSKKFDEKFTPIELETTFFTKSGKDITGFILPKSQ